MVPSPSVYAADQPRGGVPFAGTTTTSTAQRPSGSLASGPPALDERVVSPHVRRKQLEARVDEVPRIRDRPLEPRHPGLRGDDPRPRPGEVAESEREIRRGVGQETRPAGQGVRRAPPGQGDNDQHAKRHGDDRVQAHWPRRSLARTWAWQLRSPQLPTRALAAQSPGAARRRSATRRCRGGSTCQSRRGPRTGPSLRATGRRGHGRGRALKAGPIRRTAHP